MNPTNVTCRLPSVIECPHCGGQMNQSGRGKAPGSTAYFCGGCVPLLRIKELWLGQVVRTGNQGFGFIQLHGAGGLGGVHFRVQDFVAPGGRSSSAATPHVGDHVLVLLDDDPQHARRAWRVQPVARAPQNGRPANGPAPNGSPGTNGHGRQAGSITKVIADNWGFITEYGTGRELFVHRHNLRGRARLELGQRVTYLPEQTPKGLNARDVQAA
jgi:cold shock CspA family protein